LIAQHCVVGAAPAGIAARELHALSGRSHGLTRELHEEGLRAGLMSALRCDSGTASVAMREATSSLSCAVAGIASAHPVAGDPGLVRIAGLLLTSAERIECGLDLMGRSQGGPSSVTDTLTEPYELLKLIKNLHRQGVARLFDIDDSAPVISLNSCYGEFLRAGERCAEAAESSRSLAHRID
jgi:hypothetical protein